MTGERRNIAAAVAERRQGDRGRSDPFGKTGMEIVGQRSAAGRDDPDVDGIAAVEPDRADLAGRKHAVEQLLRLRRKEGHFIQNQRAAVGLDKLADLGCEGAREGALFVAEQFAVDDVRCDRLAVERDQRPLRAKAGAVDCAGDGFLARSGLADDQDRQAIARRLGGDRQGGAEFGGGADQLLQRQFGRQFLGNGRELACRAAAIRVGGKRFEQPLRRDRPNQEVGWRRRASLRQRRDTVSPCDRTMIGRFGRSLRRVAMSCAPCSRIPAPEQD